jgi:LmbE family N-acetylglucosaminyl deacetylase
MSKTRNWIARRMTIGTTNCLELQSSRGGENRIGFLAQTASDRAHVARPRFAYHRAVATTLVISPHLDDAVLSIGGSLAAWASRGRVVVATVYTAGPSLDRVPLAMRQFADYTTRRAEDAAAAAAIGVEPLWLDHVERAFRDPEQALGMRDIFTTPPTRNGFARLAAITTDLDRLLDVDREPERVAIPLGIGNHVDHVETVVAATDWALARGLADRTVFYEDLYALSRPMRRRHWIATRRQWRWWQAPLLRARRLAVLLGTIAASRRGPPIEDYLADHWRTGAWTCTPSPIAAYEQSKLAAIACYGSQTRAFGGIDGLSRALRAYHAWWGRAEPLYACR